MTEGYPVLEKKMKELGITKGKVGIDMMAFDITRKLRLGFPDIDFVEGGCVVEEAQLVKAPEEIHVPSYLCQRRGCGHDCHAG